MKLEKIVTALSLMRGVGKSYELAEVCKRKDWKLICLTQSHAKAISKTHGIEAVCMDINFNGYSGPFLLDHAAAEQLLDDATREIAQLKKDNDEFQEALDMCVLLLCKQVKTDE